MSSLRICLMLALVLALVGPAAATDYYVAQNQPGAADSNPGTEAQPWLTLGKAAGAAVAGDTVWIRAGLYQETLAPQNSGTKEKPITFQAFGDDPVFISSPTLLVTGWKKREGTKLVYEASYPMLEEALVVVDGLKVPNGCPTGPRWWLGIPGMGEVTDEPFMMGGTPVLKRCSAQGGKVTLNLGGEDPNGHRVEAVRRDFTGIMLKGDYLVVRGLQVTDVSSGVTDEGEHNLVEYVIVRNAWDSSFNLSGPAGVAHARSDETRRRLLDLRRAGGLFDVRPVSRERRHAGNASAG